MSARLILASSSPRRHELLLRAGLAFAVVTPGTEEIDDDLTKLPHELCLNNARGKAMAVAREYPDAVVVGADTLVFLEGVPLSKPLDLPDAHRMLALLAGRTHEVCTGVVLVSPARGVEEFHCLSRVTFKPLDAAAIRRYHALVNPLDKAGAYGIQEHADQIIADIEGDFDNVMGLPVAALLERLALLGIRP